jgi:hypothetical protein
MEGEPADGRSRGQYSGAYERALVVLADLNQGARAAAIGITSNRRMVNPARAVRSSRMLLRHAAILVLTGLFAAQCCCPDRATPA